MSSPKWKETLLKQIDNSQSESIEFYKSLRLFDDKGCDSLKSIASSFQQVITQKTNKYLKEHGVRPNVIVLAPEFKLLIGKDKTDFHGIPIFYSLNLSSVLGIEKSILVF